MAGMMGVGGDIRSKGLSMMQHYSSMDQKLQAEQRAMDQAEKAQNKAMAMQYGGMAGGLGGAAIAGLGMSAGPVGVLIGFGVGSLLGSVGGSFF